MRQLVSYLLPVSRRSGASTRVPTSLEHILSRPQIPPTLRYICTASSMASGQVQDQPKELPKLTASEFRVYNRMADHMNAFHNHFRQTWQMLYGACTSGKRPAGMSIKQFLGAAEQFISQLEMHHGIEEHHIFPVSFLLHTIRTQARPIV
jgi:hypothetical protein